MTSPNLPPAVIEHFARAIDAAGRASLRQAQTVMSAVYREGGHSRSAVPGATAALAYAVARMPATYAACVRSFDLTAQLMPKFHPASILDLGAGPGTATLAALSVWPDLIDAHLVEPSAALASVARELIGATTPLNARTSALDLAARLPAGNDTADLVTLSYVLAEQPEPQVAALVSQVASHVRPADRHR